MYSRSHTLLHTFEECYDLFPSLITRTRALVLSYYPSDDPSDFAAAFLACFFFSSHSWIDNVIGRYALSTCRAPSHVQTHLVVAQPNTNGLTHRLPASNAHRLIPAPTPAVGSSTCSRRAEKGEKIRMHPEFFIRYNMNGPQRIDRISPSSYNKNLPV
jgi:hypothetical protein